jgi:hypothetical protein
MADLIQLRRGTAAFWTSTNPVLSQGEIGIETDTGLEKRGDGTTAWTSLGYFDKDNVGLSQVDNAKQQVWHGFPTPYVVILSYDPVTRQATLTPTGSTFDIWVNGIKFTKTGAQSSTAHADTTGNYFVSYDASGNLQVSNAIWDIDGSSIPVWYGYYNANLVDAIPLFELHTAKRNPAWHKSQHHAIGTFIRSGLEISGYTLNTANNTDLTYAIASGIIVDEDIDVTITALPDDGPYTILHRTGATEWTWTVNNSYPFRYTTTGYIEYNQNNGGSYQLTPAVASRWVNYFVFATTAIPHTLSDGAPVSTSNKRFLIVPSQTIHTTLASAQGESLASISWGGILIPEIVGAWKWTYETKSNYNTVGKVQAVEVARISLTRSQLTGNFTAGSHNALTGRDSADSHPASAITNTPAGTIAAVTVQAALNELDSEKAPLASPTFTGVASFPDGSASAPSITNTDDPDTGIYFPAADTVGISSGGNDRVSISADSTDIAKKPLNISYLTKTVAAGLCAEVGSDILNIGLNEDSGNRFGGSYDSDKQGAMIRFDSRVSNNPITFMTRASGSTVAVSVKMGISPSGNVLIGTTTDGGTGVLQANGHINITSGNSLKINGTQVVGAQGAAVANATNTTDVITQLNALLARLRAHGLIAT